MTEYYSRKKFVSKFGKAALASIFLNNCKNKIHDTNIVFILSDDLSKYDVSCYGNSAIKTPNIDRIAEEGLKFHRAYTPTAMCAPARASLYTGLYPHRNGVHMNHGSTKSSVLSLPIYLNELGYRVGLSGKKHIYPLDVYPFEYMSDDKDSIDDFIGKNDTPFCLIFASNEPHGPHNKGNYSPKDVSVPPYQIDTQETRELLANYYADIDIHDKEVGVILDLLDKHNLTSNTIVFFASDNGFELFAKWTCYEAGLNVPFLVRWPNKINPGTKTNAMISFADFVPTLIDIAGGQVPGYLDGKSFKSVLLNEKLTHHKYIYGTHTNRGIWSGETYPIRSIRNKRYKYIQNLYSEGKFTCIPTNGWDYNEENASEVFKSWKKKALTDDFAAKRVIHLQKRPPEELYDLEKDPYELNNIINKKGVSDIVVELKSELQSWMEQQGDFGLESELQVEKKLPKKADY